MIKYLAALIIPLLLFLACASEPRTTYCDTMNELEVDMLASRCLEQTNVLATCERRQEFEQFSELHSCYQWVEHVCRSRATLALADHLRQCREGN